MASGTIKVRDPIHGFIEVPSEWARIVDTPTFQHLRGIRQLAFANHVYPGALHTRFDHTLGVFHLACQMAEALNITHSGKTREDRRTVEAAALLHDLGHGPFSHVSENVLERFADRSKLPDDLKKEKIHELITADIIRHDEFIANKLDDQLQKSVLTLLKGEGGQHSVLRDIVSGPLDADKQDYLLRDSYFCGVQYGRFDLQQLHRSLGKVSRTFDGNEFLMVERGGLHVVEQYVLAKYYMTSQVYRHKVRLITDQMLTRALVLGVEQDNLPELRRLYTYDGSREFIENYKLWDDARLINTFTDDEFAGTGVHYLLTRLRDRHLLKRAYAQSLAAPAKGSRKPVFDARNRRALSELGKIENDKQRHQLEQNLASVISDVAGQSIDPRWVVTHVYTLKSVREQARNDESSILVGKSNDFSSLVDFDQASTVFNSINDQMNETYLEIFAPLDYEGQPAKSQLVAKLRAPIEQALKNIR